MDSTIPELKRAIEASALALSPPAVCLSGGLDSTILAYHLRRSRPVCIAVIASDFLATDLTYCQMASARLNLPLRIRWVSGKEILDSVEETIRILGNFNDIEIRNSVVMHMAALELKEAGMATAATGDGADELFAGYDFLVKKSGAELEQELDRMRSIMHFPSQKIGRSLGVEFVAPYLDERVISLASKIPGGLKVGSRGGVRVGKMILRKAYEDVIPEAIAWRPKSPMQDGAGTEAITGLLSSLIPDGSFEEESAKALADDGVTLRTKESMYYYRIFRRHFGRPSGMSGSGSPCPQCGYGTPAGSRFCRMCGAYPI